MSERSRAEQSLWTPMRYSLVWLAGTFLLFLGVGEVEEIDNLEQLTLYVGFTILCFAVGYRLSAMRYRQRMVVSVPESEGGLKQVRFIVALSALYYIAYAATYMDQFGVLSVSALSNALTNPGEAYRAKFVVFETLEATGATSTAAQAVTLSAVLLAPLAPFLVVYWSRLSGAVRLLGVFGVATYSVFFLAIGTLVGLGNLVIFALAGILVRRAQRAEHVTERVSPKRRRLVALGIIVALGFGSYMAYNQGNRVQGTTVEDNFTPNPLVQSLTNERFALGVAVTAFYPTHGYTGLAHNLGTPFEWTGGRGASRALDGYLSQYGVADSVADRTYPARTEVLTGWPAGMYWATIYPWLASDLTFIGAALFMGVVGWWMARWWFEAVVLRSRISLLMLGQAMILIAFVPANHQLGLSRPNLICFTTLLVIYIFTKRPEPVALGPKAPRMPACQPAA